MALKFPGLCASPLETAKWCKSVAEEEFGLPGILPIMASAVELTSAWTAEGCLDDIPGYSGAIDYDSLGMWQQRPSQGWGTREQILDPEYSLRAFCREAERIEDDSPADTPEQLGAWVAAVQRPREDLRYLYAAKGYPIAKELIDQIEDEDVTYPQRNIGFDTIGWAIDLETNAFLRSTLPVIALSTDVNGWLFRHEEPPARWEWPVAIERPRAGNYVARHPDRYDSVWRPHVESWARYLVNNYDCWVNTYYDHPEGFGRDADSMDIWGPGGRNDPLDPDLGDIIFSEVFDDPNWPHIEWTIYKRWMWTYLGGWERWGYDDFTWHDDHIHVTYIP